MLHGNVVRPSGMEHVALPWSPGHVLLAAASPITGAVASARLSQCIGVGEGDRFPVVEVGDDLTIRRATWRAARVADRRWLLLAADRGVSVNVTLDDDGAPAGLADADGLAPGGRSPDLTTRIRGRPVDNRAIRACDGRNSWITPLPAAWVARVWFVLPEGADEPATDPQVLAQAGTNGAADACISGPGAGEKVPSGTLLCTGCRRSAL